MWAGASDCGSSEVGAAVAKDAAARRAIKKAVKLTMMMAYENVSCYG